MSSDLESQDTADAEDALAEGSEEKQKLDLQIKIEQPSACERHIAVTISADDVQRYKDEAYTELMPGAQVPGFRSGRAPRKLVESKFKEQVKEQIKGSLLMDSLSQVNDDQELSAISEPDFDYDAIEVPDEGPMTYEFELEVRPDFDMPQWQGLQIEKPVRDFTDDDVEKQLRSIMSRYGELIESEEPVAADDMLTVNIVFRHDGKEISRLDDESIRVKPELSFHDGKIEDFEKSIVGATKGEKRTLKLNLSDDAESESLQGKTIDAEVEVLTIEKMDLPEFDESILEKLGGFESEAALREGVQSDLERQLSYHQQRRVRQQITDLLIESADWDLPPDMLRRQARRELERAVLELQSHGFTPEQIRTHENELRQNSMRSTAKALKEHFILERIAEDEEIEADPEDFDMEVIRIAAQSGENPRRVRARLEKRGMMDTLRNQIVERRVIEVITSQANFDETVFELPANTTEAVDFSVCLTSDSAIPAVKEVAEKEVAEKENEEKSGEEEKSDD
jgi:trigger factor